MIVAIIGFFSGILSGMGIGGGMILIPSLHIICNIEQHTAQSVNLYYFIPSAICAILIHIKNKNIDYKAALSLVIGGVPFSLIGAYLSVKMSPKILSKLFAVFIFIFGVSEIIRSFKSFKEKRQKI